MSTAVTRSTMSGVEIEPDQRITAYEALRASTTNAAFVGGVEGDLRKIEPGKLADFAILDRNPVSVAAEQLAEIGVEMTVLGGRIVHDRLGTHIPSNSEESRSAPLGVLQRFQDMTPRIHDQ